MRTYLKKVFMSGVARRAKTDWPKLGVGRSVQVLKILKYSCGLNLTSALHNVRH